MSSKNTPPEPRPSQPLARRLAANDTVRPVTPSENFDFEEPAPSKRTRTIQPDPQPEPKRRRSGISLGVLVFTGSLLGSLLGVAADFGEAASTFERFQSLFYPDLCVVGSDTILGTDLGVSGAWEAEFEHIIDVENETQSADRVDVVVDAIGSVRGVTRAVEGGCVNVLAMSEPIPISDVDRLNAAGVQIQCPAHIGYDVIAFITEFNNPVTALLRPQLQDALRGSIDNWSRFRSSYETPIQVLYRPGSGTTDFVFRNVINHTDPENPPPGADNYLPCDSNEDCLNRALSTPGALYWVSTAWMRTQPENYLRVLPIIPNEEATPINPMEENVNLEEYPFYLIRPLYLYVLTRADTSAETQRMSIEFVDYVRSVRGQQVLEGISTWLPEDDRERRFYAHFNRPADVSVPLPKGFSLTADGMFPNCTPVEGSAS